MPRWLLYSVLTVLFWGIWGFIPSKLNLISAEQSQIISTIGLLPILGYLLWKRNRLTGTRVGRGCTIALLAGLIGSVGNVFYYRLINSGKSAATVVPLTSLYPLVTVVLAVLLLRERLNKVQLAGICLALVSIYLFNVRRDQPFSVDWFLLSTVPIALWGVAGLLQKLCTNDLSAELSTFCFLVALIPLSLGLLAFKKMAWQLSASTWAWGIGLGFCLGLGNLTLLAAFATGGKAAIVTPLSGLYSLVTIPLAVGVMGDKVGGREWWAIGLALLAVVALAAERQTTNEHEQRGKPRMDTNEHESPRVK